MVVPKIKRVSFLEMLTTPASAANPSSISFAYAETSISYPNKKRTPFECVICLGSYKINVPHGTDKCSHKICKVCTRQYFHSALKDKRYKSYECVHCPSPGCKESFITDKVLLNFFSKAEIKRWWSTAISNAYMKNKVFS